MINSQEIIERSVYQAILDVAVSLGYSLNPNDYLPQTLESQRRFEADIGKLKKFIPIYGTGNAESKDRKITPRIVVNARGFYPGSIGMPKELIEKQVGVGYKAYEQPYETIDQQIDVHLVANNQEDLRLLHQILFWALPQRGYIKPYTESKPLKSGNIFIEVTNFYDSPNNTLGIMEKTYQYLIYDCLPELKGDGKDIAAIANIDTLLEDFGYNLLEISS